MLDEGALLSIFDPKVEVKQVESDLGLKYSNEGNLSSWAPAKSISEAADNADAIVLLTEWEEFKFIEWNEITKKMRSPSSIIDTRNIIDQNYIFSNGTKVWRLGVDN